MEPLIDFPVTLTFIAVSAALLTPVTGWIGTYRGKVNILRGHGDDPILFKRIRAHGNFTETAPLVAMTLLAGEGLGLAATWLWAVVALYALGRVLHWHMYDMKIRGAAMSLITMPSLAVAVWVLATLWG